MREYTPPMEHLSEWHALNPTDQRTYPKVDSPLQVRYGSGKTEEGFSSDFFPGTGLLSDSLIVGWRYIKG